MLYTQNLTIENGRTSSGMLGGSPYDEERPTWQVGYATKPRQGLIRVDNVQNDVRIFDCTITVFGYHNKPITTSRAPGRVIVELPCSVEVIGPESVNGLQVLIEAWETASFPDRGACRSFLSPVESATAIPPWASAFDLPAPAIVTFRDNAAAIVGVVPGPVVNFSIPSSASNFTVASETANLPIVFRQQG